MRIKKSVVLFILLICCGCTAKYKIDFTNENISEKLLIKTKRNNLTNNQVKQMYSEAFYAINRDSFYNFDNSKSTADEIVLEYNYDFNTSNIKSSNLIKSCIEYFDFFEEDNKYYLIGKGAFKCSIYEYVELDSIDISITTNHNVIENNADEIKNDEYIWHIDLEDLENINIKFITDNKISTKSKVKEYKGILIPLGIASGVILLITLLIMIKHKRVNKI